jgi:ATP-binding cassette subfamily B protein
MIASARALGLVCLIAFRVSRFQTLLAFGETVAKVLHALNPIFYGLFASGAVHRDSRQLTIAVVGLVGTIVVSVAMDSVGSNARLKQLTYVGFEFSRRVSTTMATIETLDHHEDPELLDKLEAFRARADSLGQVLNGILNSLNTLAFSVATVVVALSADWRLLLLAALGIPRLLLVKRTAGWDKRAEEQSSPHRRLADRLVDLASDVDAGAEIRVFGLRTELLKRINGAASAWQRPEIRRADQHAAVNLANGLLYFGGAAAIIGWILYDATQGRVSIAAVTVAVTCVGSLQGVSSYIVNVVKTLTDAARSANRFVWLQDYAATVHSQHSGETLPPERLRSGIRLEGVSYRYTGADADSLCDVDLELPAGSVVALVGENGAGKSTLVKLLTGMYQPTAGRILIDDVDLAEIDLTAWRARTSGAFQDHANFELSAMESIGVGDLARVEDESEVRRALHDGAATDVLTAMPQGLQTQLGASWPDGVDLSGGQWQRLAIARGMMRPELLMLALDEPTSALDAATEHALFDRYAEAAQDVGHRGAVTLLVTHRFSTVAAADIVLVLENGRIIERGSHDQLMAAGGRYAELYEIQAKGYR